MHLNRRVDMVVHILPAEKYTGFYRLHNHGSPSMVQCDPKYLRYRVRPMRTALEKYEDAASLTVLYIGRVPRRFLSKPMSKKSSSWHVPHVIVPIEAKDGKNKTDRIRTRRPRLCSSKSLALCCSSKLIGTLLSLRASTIRYEYHLDHCVLTVQPSFSKTERAISTLFEATSR